MKTFCLLFRLACVRVPLGRIEVPKRDLCVQESYNGYNDCGDGSDDLPENYTDTQPP